MENSKVSLSDYGVLLLQEAALHPNSVIKTLEDKFEKPSIAFVTKRDGLRQYTKPPIYDDKYLVIFEDVRTFISNLPYVKLAIMFVVVVCPSKSMIEDAKAACINAKVGYSIYTNRFDKQNAYILINNLATVQPTKTFCDALISRVGLSPTRLVSAIMICEQVGYKVKNINSYIDKYVYIDVLDVIESLLGICKSAAQKRRAALYLHMNRLWYKRFTKDIITSEIKSLLDIYYDLVEGKLTYYSVQDYLENNRVSRRKVMYTFSLYEKVSLIELVALYHFVKEASLLEIVMKLS